VEDVVDVEQPAPVDDRGVAGGPDPRLGAVLVDVDEIRVRAQHRVGRLGRRRAHHLVHHALELAAERHEAVAVLPGVELGRRHPSDRVDRGEERVGRPEVDHALLHEQVVLGRDGPLRARGGAEDQGREAHQAETDPVLSRHEEDSPFVK
jgi:hypothetical protein